MLFSVEEHADGDFHGRDNDGFGGAQGETYNDETGVSRGDTVKEDDYGPGENCDCDVTAERELLHEVVSRPLEGDIAW